MGNDIDQAAAAFAGLAALPAEMAGVKALVTMLVEKVDRLVAQMPPAVGDVARVCELTGLSAASVHRRIKEGVFRRVAGGGHGQRVLIDLGSIRGPDDEEVAKLAREAREGRGA